MCENFGKGHSSEMHVKESPQQDMVKLLDRLLIHRREISAIEERKKAETISLKQEACTSHCDQVFD